MRAVAALDALVAVVRGTLAGAVVATRAAQVGHVPVAAAASRAGGPRVVLESCTRKLKEKT